MENRLSLAQLMNMGVSCPTANSVAPSTNVTASRAFTLRLRSGQANDGDTLAGTGGTRVK